MAPPWTLTTFVLTFAMWWVMMLGMMVPSATPMVLTFAALNRSKRRRGQDFVPTSIFLFGYLIAWGLFSIIATLAQWALDQVALLSPTLSATSPVLGGMLAILAGLYQFTPLKQSCLRNCRSPFAFVWDWPTLVDSLRAWLFTFPSRSFGNAPVRKRWVICIQERSAGAPDYRTLQCS